jgi:hypothetical protein
MSTNQEPTARAQLAELLASRQGMELNAELDANRNEILVLLKSTGKIPFEDLFTALTEMGYAPALVFDDNGQFAVSCEGVSTVVTNYTADKRNGETTITVIIGGTQWRPSVLSAMDAAVDAIAADVLGI